METEEFFKLSTALEKYHGVFSKLWNLGKPSETNEIPTACVQFNEEGDCVDFMINPEFWAKSSFNHKLFIICHECLHVLLNHGIRGKDIPKGNRDTANVAMDICINHMLEDSFGFDRESIDNWKDYCWLETVFNEEELESVERGKHFEYYYKVLLSNGNAEGQSLIDVHEFMNEGSCDPSQEFIEQVSDSVDTMSEDEKKVLKEILDKEENNLEQDNNVSQKAGTMSGNVIRKLNVGPVNKKRKWETVIKKWCQSKIIQTSKSQEQWARCNRRFMLLDNEFFLPTEMEIDDVDTKKDKIKVWFFLDTSGSCYHLANRFFKAAKSLPEDKFELRLFCFDTRVYETTLASQKVYGYGGTSFCILEHEIQRQIKRNVKDYPKAVFVITDGYGDNIRPQFPKNWHWFLTTNATYCIPSQCNIYQLKDYE